MPFDSRQDLDGLEFRSLDGTDWSDGGAFRIGATPAFFDGLGTSFEALERLATFAYSSHALNCCPCGQDHSADLMAHKISLAAATVEIGARLVSEGTQFAPDGSPEQATVLIPGEAGGTTTTAGTIALGDSIVSQIEVSGDQDWFAIQLEAGVTYEFTLNGSGANALGDPYLEIMNSTGSQAAFNDDGGVGLNSTLRFTPTRSGVFYVNAHGWIDAGGATSTGTYTLTAIQAPPLPTYTVAEIANYLVTQGSSAGRHWNQTTITYNIQALTAAQQTLAERALAMWSAVTPLTFTRVTSGGNITFTNVDPDPDPADPTAAAAYAQNTFTGNFITASTVVITSNWQSGDTAFDSYTQQTYIHEIGHALGLGHAGPYNGTADWGTDNIYTNDNWAQTVMSYFDQQESGHGSYRFVLGLQQADIVAAQTLYGARPGGTNAGNTTFGFNSTAPGTNIDWSQFVLVQAEGTYRRPPSMTIYDTAGVDTINLSGFSQPQILDLRPGTFSSLGDRPIAGQVNYSNVISIAAGTIIENAVGGAGGDTITGNDANNTITLGGGADTFVYLTNGGADTITDFSVAVDRIDLTAFSSAAALAAFNGRTASAGGTLLTFAAGQTILLQGVSTGQLTQANLILSGSPPPPPPPPPPGTLTGTPNADYLVGTASNDQIFGLGGSDTLVGLQGNDVLDGGDGDDVLIGGEGADQMIGGTGFDIVSYFYATTGVNFNVLTGGTSGEAAGDSYSGIEMFYGSQFGDTIQGSDGNDQIAGFAGNDFISTGISDDVIIGGEGADTLDGGEGFDIASYFYAQAGVTFNVVTGGTGGEASGDVFISIEMFYGSNFNDEMVGDSAGDFLIGFGGDDRLFGNGGNDQLIGGAGADLLDGGSGYDIVSYYTSPTGVNFSVTTGGTAGDALGDTYVSIEMFYGSPFSDIMTGGVSPDFLVGFEGNDTLNGGSGDDTMVGGAGADFFDGGEGFDTVSYYYAGAGVTFNVAVSGTGGEAAGDTYVNNEMFYGSFFADSMTGSDANEWLVGFDGNDTLNGGGGNDTLIGGNGADTLIGGSGYDVASYYYALSGVSVNLQTGGTGGDATGDTYFQIEQVYGSNFGDTLIGSNSNDSLAGFDGNDTIDGGLGSDQLIGGGGADLFVVRQYNNVDQDVIVDFAHGSDKVRLVGSGFASVANVLAAISQSGGNAVLTFASGASVVFYQRQASSFTAQDFELVSAMEPSNGDHSLADTTSDSFDFSSLPTHSETIEFGWGEAPDVQIHNPGSESFVAVFVDLPFGDTFDFHDNQNSHFDWNAG
ncbi:MAG: M10 family metallopeptidase C-terminal domain-containing protein [Acidobacteria bacterium]|nr:M10 family metallopeptidase C-terminal domain-containing protein [Acidobacteriota bacterium]